MEILGFIALILFALYCIAGGVIVVMAANGFGGQLGGEGWMGVAVFLFGCYLLYLSYKYSPIAVVVQ